MNIGPVFFAKIKSDYGDWQFALLGELFQNSMDARGTTRIESLLPSCGNNHTTPENPNLLA